MQYNVLLMMPFLNVIVVFHNVAYIFHMFSFTPVIYNDKISVDVYHGKFTYNFARYKCYTVARTPWKDEYILVVYVY